VNYLVDLLQEDLNRIDKKEFGEYSEEEGRSDEQIAKEYWDKHIGRNNSIISDIMTG
jgi:ubiquitin C-terminal hydrolase